MTRAESPPPVADRPDRIRLFVALELPSQVRHELVRWRDQVAGGVPGLRRVGSENLHVTLCFLGWQASAEIDRLAAVCAGTVDDVAGAEVQLGAPLWLPPRRPRVLAVELIDGAGALTALQSALSRELERRGAYQPEKRRFRPHVTVARVGREGPNPARRQPPKSLERPPGLRFCAPWVTLFQSRLSPSGARYEALCRCEWRSSGRLA